MIFANGAATAAFAAIVSSAMQKGGSDPYDSSTSSIGSNGASGPVDVAATQKQIRDLQTDLSAAEYGSFKEAAQAIHDSGLGKLYSRLKVEGWAVIDRGTYSIKEFGVGSRTRAVGIYDGRYRYGDAVWHSHPSGKDIHVGDWESAFYGGRRGRASAIFASGNRLTGYFLSDHNPPFTTQYDFKSYSGSWRFTKHIYENGSWGSVSGSFSK